MRHNDGLLTSIKISLRPMLIPCAPTRKEVDKTKKSGLGYRTFKAALGRLICHMAQAGFQVSNAAIEKTINAFWNLNKSRQTQQPCE